MIANELSRTGVLFMATEAFTVSAEAELVHQLDHLADSLARSRNDVVNQALKEYLEQYVLQIEKITQGIAAADRGELVDHYDVMSEMENLIERKAQGKA
jgi:predicted transcriptional regulator